MEKKEILDEKLKSHLRRIAPDGLFPFLLEGGNYRGAFLSGTALVNQARVNHRLGVLETLVLGHGCIAAGLLSVLLKDPGKYGLMIECGGPIQGLAVEGDYLGNVRGRLFANPIVLDRDMDRLDMNLLFGPGFLTVTRYSGEDMTPFSGQIMMEYGSIAQDLALYFQQSEQTPSVFSLSVHFDDVGRVLGAGGLFLQLMPGAPAEGAGELEDRITGLPSLGKFLAEDTGGEVGCGGEANAGREDAAGGAKGSAGAVEGFLEEQFRGFGYTALPRRPVEFFCGCNRERFSSFLGAMKEAEKTSLMEGPFPVIVDCQNCGTSYSFDRDEAAALISQGGDPL